MQSFIKNCTCFYVTGLKIALWFFVFGLLPFLCAGRDKSLRFFSKRNYCDTVARYSYTGFTTAYAHYTMSEILLAAGALERNSYLHLHKAAHQAVAGMSVLLSYRPLSSPECVYDLASIRCGSFHTERQVSHSSNKHINSGIYLHTFDFANMCSKEIKRMCKKKRYVFNKRELAAHDQAKYSRTHCG